MDRLASIDVNSKQRGGHVTKDILGPSQDHGDAAAVALCCGEADARRTIAIAVCGLNERAATSWQAMINAAPGPIARWLTQTAKILVFSLRYAVNCLKLPLPCVIFGLDI